MLGWLSFIFVLTTARHQAVHDLVARSLVIHKDTSGLPAFEVLGERAYKSKDYVLPSAWRRIAVIIAYAIFATVVLSVASFLVSTTACTEAQRCTTLDKLIEIVLSVLLLVGLGGICVLGWTGRLYGCRRRQSASESENLFSRMLRARLIQSRQFHLPIVCPRPFNSQRQYARHSIAACWHGARIPRAADRQMLHIETVVHSTCR